MSDDINDPRKVEPCTSRICWDLFAPPFFDPSIRGLHIMRRMNTVHETDSLVLRKLLSKLFVFSQPLLLLFFVGLTRYHRRLFIGKIVPLQPTSHAMNGVENPEGYLDIGHNI